MSVPLWTVSRSEVTDLVVHCLDQERSKPLVIASLPPGMMTPSPRLPVEEMQRYLYGLDCELAVFRDIGTNKSFCNIAPASLSVHGGAIRVVVTGVTANDDTFVCPILTVFSGDDVEHKLGRLRNLVLKAINGTLDSQGPGQAGRYGSSSTVDGELVMAVPPSQPAPSPLSIKPMASSVAECPSPSVATLDAPTPEPARVKVDADALADKVATRLEKRIDDRIEQTLTRLVGSSDSSSTAELDDLRATVEKLTAELKQARHELSVHQGDGAAPMLYSDHDRQLRWEAEFAYLTTTPEPERITFPAYEMSQEFVEAAFNNPPVPRDKVVEVMVDVLVGRVHQRRTTHQQGTGGREPTGPTRVSPKGGTCWRVYLREHMAGGPRMNYNAEPDGSFFFEKIGLHDDTY